MIDRMRGDYRESEISARADDVTGVIARRTAEALALGTCGLVFCCDVRHAETMAEALRGEGLRAAALTQKATAAERAGILEALKAGELDAIANCSILTTGFDHPPIDVLVLARPTRSTVLAHQMLGRGMRTSPGKEECHVLDFGGVIPACGPITDPVIPVKLEKGKPRPPTEPAAMACPSCSMLLPPASRTCPGCGWAKPLERALATVSSDADPLGTRGEWHRVERASWAEHVGPSGVPSARMTLTARADGTGKTVSVATFFPLDHPKAARTARNRLATVLGRPGPRVSVTELVRNPPPAPELVRLGENERGYPTILEASRKWRWTHDGTEHESPRDPRGRAPS